MVHGTNAQLVDEITTGLRNECPAAIDLLHLRHLSDAPDSLPSSETLSGYLSCVVSVLGLSWAKRIYVYPCNVIG